MTKKNYQRKHEKNVEFILCWPNTPGHNASFIVWLIYPMTLTPLDTPHLPSSSRYQLHTASSLGRGLLVRLLFSA